MQFLFQHFFNWSFGKNEMCSWGLGEVETFVVSTKLQQIISLQMKVFKCICDGTSWLFSFHIYGCQPHSLLMSFLDVVSALNLCLAFVSLHFTSVWKYFKCWVCVSIPVVAAVYATGIVVWVFKRDAIAVTAASTYFLGLFYRFKITTNVL